MKLWQGLHEKRQRGLIFIVVPFEKGNIGNKTNNLK